MDVTKGEFVGAVTALHFSADGSLLYAAVGCTLYVYDSATGKMFTSPLSIWSQGTIHGIDIGRTRTSSLVLCFGQKQLGLVTSFPDSSSEVTPLSPSIVATECMDWILDARLLLDDMDSSKVALPKIAVGLSHNMVHIWDPSTQAMLQRCQSQVTQRLHRHVWSVAGECLATLSGHLDTNVWRVAVHPIHTTWVATGGGDNAIKLWDVDSHIANQSLVHVKAVPTLVAPSATTNDGGLVAERSKKNHHAMAVRSLVALASSIVWISDQGHVGKSSWSAHAPAVVQQFQSNVCCVAATTDLIAVGDVTGHLRMLSGTSLAELAIVQGHMGRIMSIWIIETSHREIGGVTVFTTGVDLTLREWTFHSPTSSLTLVATYQCPSKNGCISALAIPTTDGGNDDRTLLWCGDARGNLCVPRQVYQYRAHDMGVNCVCIRPTGATTFDIVSGGDDQCITHAAVDATDRSNITVRHLHGKRNASASALKAIQAMDDVVVAAGYDQRVTAWEMNGGHEWTRRGVAYSECADIAGVALRRCDGGAIEAVVVGKGMQTIAFR
ncbi:hypothetical protein DYB32_006137 [Aphanomyces invadans]|uniref:Anaphase-promoting complex subunit 4 WD40 domain-containing protein n=1 Tax=Aphanomyces invadans TaxID=157072 RepID=A0A3R6VVD6_9STRA|nr:hypothetical protein DYB32_006137 [Aphanomyces invadans]